MDLDKFLKIVAGPKGFGAFVFSCRAALAAVIAYLVLRKPDPAGALWASVSAVIVIQPGLHPSIKASLLRFAANLIGAFVGAGVLSLLGPTSLSLAIGVLLTGLICHCVRLDDAVRPAFASVVIVMLRTGSNSVWFGSLDRVFAVIVGCSIALALTFIADKCFRKAESTAAHAPKPGDAE